MKSKREINRIPGFSGDQLVKTAEVLSLLSISMATKRDLVFKGLLNPIMLGKKAQRFSLREVNQLIEKIKSERTGIQVRDNNSEFSPEEKVTLHAICAEFPG